MKRISKLLPIIVAIIALLIGIAVCFIVFTIESVEEENPILLEQQVTYQALPKPVETPLHILPEEKIVEQKIETIEPKSTNVFIEIPDCKTNMYFYMDYRTITDPTSPQWEFQQEQAISIDTETGIQIFKHNEIDYYIVALGGVCGTDIGATYKVILDNGSEFYMILGDVKANTYWGHSCVNYDGYYCVNMVEFIVDSNYVNDKILYDTGTFSSLDFFNGNIVSIEYLGIIWESDFLN